MKFLSLFAGVGGLDVGLEKAGWECVGQCEIDPFCQLVLRERFPSVNFRWRDVCDLPTELVRYACGDIDAIVGGFACQDISVAGKGAGLQRFTRSGVTFRNAFRLIRGLRPLLLVLENVPALRNRGADRVLRVLERIGYACRCVVVSAENVGAPHRRQRVFIVGHLANAAAGGCQHGAGLREHGEPRGRRESAGSNSLGSARGIGGLELADAPRGGLGADGGTQGNPGHADQRGPHAFGVGGSTLADSECVRGREQQQGRGPQGRAAAGGNGEAGDMADARRAGLEERRGGALCRPAQLAVHAADGRHGALRWPARPGQPQHPWESPRLVRYPRQFELPLGFGADGASAELVRHIREIFDFSDEEAKAWYARNKVRLDRAQNKHALKALGNAVVWPCAYVIARSINRALSEE